MLQKKKKKTLIDRFKSHLRIISVYSYLYKQKGENVIF